MSSMAAVISKTPFLSHPLTKSGKSDFPLAIATASVSFPSTLRSRSLRRGGGSFQVRSGLIEPDGGKLVELVVDEPRRREKKHEAAELPRVELTTIDLQWMQVLSEGWASPLGGFMRESEFLQTLHFNSLRLDDGSVVNMSVPIVLAIDDEQKARIGESTKVALVDSDGNPVAILKDIEIYKHPKEERIARTWGTTAPGLPYVEEAITNAGNWLIGGDLEVLEPVKYNDGLDRFRLSPSELRKELEKRGADAVFAFQLRNPPYDRYSGTQLRNSVKN